MKTAHLAACLMAMLLCAACEQLPIARRAPAPLPPVSERPVAAQPRPTPIAPHEIDLAGVCRRTEDDGFREDAQVKVSHNAVEALKWKLWVSKRGMCHFDLEEFRQVRQTPHIELHAIDGSQCTLMVWQDPRRITLAHAHCENHCTPGIYEEAWPVLFDPKSGACAQIR